MRKVYLVSLVALTAACAANPRPSVSNSVKPAKERTVIHLLSRTTFGPRAADVDRLYLDTWLSAAAQKGPAPGRGLNENYGRELVELHTLGVDGGYTQRDVVELARCFTGWTLANPHDGMGFEFKPAMHDRGEKHVLGHTMSAGRGIEDGEEVLDILAGHERRVG